MATQRLSAREVRLAQKLNDGLDLFEAVRIFRNEINGRMATKRKGASETPSYDSNRWLGALRALKELSIHERIPIAIIGGVAAVEHGYERYTEDMDVVVSTTDLQKMTWTCHEYGFQLDSKHNPHSRVLILRYNGLKIEVVGEGMFTGDNRDLTHIPSPAELGVTKGLKYVPLEKWVHLKLASGRGKDLIDIVEVLKRKKNPAEVQAVENYLQNVSLRYAEKFAELIETAEREKQQEARFSEG